ncbi:MAG: hypothetical protein ACK4K7_10805 [Allosphingosinicella sp.]|uniref:hypothetical protein n=1 Tax=Allosphingosinicella sp. TaxID=2823234 RepID=UPI003920AC11
MRFRAKLLLLGGASSLLLALPALSQSAPESLLPPGFGDPERPAPAPTPTPRAETPPPGFGDPERPEPAPRAAPPPPPPAVEAAQRDLVVVEPISPRQFDIPDSARRPVEVVGVLGPGNWGVGADPWGGANGGFLSTLMRRLDAPLPSRWTSMLLRRALLTRAPAPSLVDPVDWVADRAWLLVRMGEADAARMLVEAVDVDRYTPRMIQVAVQTALATADPAALCPLVEPGRAGSNEPVWPLADAMCAALEGEASRASALIDQARRRSGARGIDLLLAEKIVGAGTDTRRAVTIQWDEVDSINSWRFGLASATGMAIPDRLMAATGPQVQAWLARAPMVPLQQRMDAAEVAASLGVFSHQSLVEMHSLILDGTDPAEAGGTTAARLRQAYVAAAPGDRMAAIRRLWDEAEAPHQRHARRILTAGAAARLEPSEELAEHAGELIASMLIAGLDQQAARWAEIADAASGTNGDRAWALLAVGAPNAAVDVSASRIEAFRGRDNSRDQHRSRILLAALAGLDRIDRNAAGRLAGSMGVDLGRDSPWSRALISAVRNQQRGTVILLSAVGMQTGDWRGVPPEHLFQIVRALRVSGMEYEARMIAAEALSRL